MSGKKKAHSDCLAAGSGLAEANSAREHDTAMHEANVREVRYMVKTTARDAYGRLCDFARRRAAAHRQFGVQEWAESERRQPRVDGSGNDFKVNNSLLPIYARMVASDLPEVRPYVELRASVYDRFFPELGRADHAAS